MHFTLDSAFCTPLCSSAVNDLKCLATVAIVILVLGILGILHWLGKGPREDTFGYHAFGDFGDLRFYLVFRG